MRIRPAVASDAIAACGVMRRSITDLCVIDHRNNTMILGRWLANKTPENFAAWIAEIGSTMLVAEHDGVLAAVGGVKDDGEITLNYVSPDFRFRGVSKSVLAKLEAISLEKGNAGCSLFSTATAYSFYRAAGYRDGGEPVEMFRTISYPMFKRIVAP